MSITFCSEGIVASCSSVANQLNFVLVSHCHLKMTMHVSGRSGPTSLMGIGVLCHTDFRQVGTSKLPAKMLRPKKLLAHAELEEHECKLAETTKMSTHVSDHTKFTHKILGCSGPMSSMRVSISCRNDFCRVSTSTCPGKMLRQMKLLTQAEFKQCERKHAETTKTSTHVSGRTRLAQRFA